MAAISEDNLLIFRQPVVRLLTRTPFSWFAFPTTQSSQYMLHLISVWLDTSQESSLGRLRRRWENSKGIRGNVQDVSAWRRREWSSIPQLRAYLARDLYKSLYSSGRLSDSSGPLCKFTEPTFLGLWLANLVVKTRDLGIGCHTQGAKKVGRWFSYCYSTIKVGILRKLQVSSDGFNSSLFSVFTAFSIFQRDCLFCWIRIKGGVSPIEISWALWNLNNKGLVDFFHLAVYATRVLDNTTLPRSWANMC